MRVKVLEGILPISRATVLPDIVAGVTLASLAIPEVMGYATIAGMPIVTGLYTMLVPVILFALLGSSRHLVVGADSATAAILASGLVGVAAAGSAEYVALAQALALMAGLLLIAARVIGLGFLADFLSRSVLIGFLTGVGIQVALGRVPDLFGIAVEGHNTLERVANGFANLGAASWPTFLLALGILAVILLLRRISARIPAAFLAVVLAIVASWVFGLSDRGVAVLGTVPGGAPSLVLPNLAVDWRALTAVVPTAFTMCLVILAQSAATSRAYAAKYEDRFSENTDLVGLAAANLGAGLSGAFVVNGSPTKTAMADTAGAKSQIAQLTAASVVLIVLLFLTAPLALLPNVTLAVVVLLIGLKLIDIRGMRELFQKARPEFWVALLTTGAVVVAGVEKAIILAVVISLIQHTRIGYHPKNQVAVASDGDAWTMQDIDQPQQVRPGLMVYRFSHSLYYANAEWFAQETARLTARTDPPLRWFCIDAGAIDEIDFTGGKAVAALSERLKTRDIRLVFISTTPTVRAELSRYGIASREGEPRFFDTMKDLFTAFRSDAAHETSS